MPTLDSNPWFSIWRQPRKTVRALVDSNPRYGFVALSAIYGFPMFLQIAQNFCFIGAMTIGGVLLSAIILAVVVGVIGIFIASALIYWTGKTLGGNASFLQIRCAVSWANITNIPNIVFWLILIGYFKEQVLCNAFAQAPFTKPETAFVVSVFILQFVFSVWSFILLLNGISEVQKFSIWKAAFNVVIAFLIVLAVMWIYGWIIGQV